MYKRLLDLEFSRKEVSGIRMRLINVFLDKNQNYSIERMTNDINVAEDDVVLVKSGYFNDEKSEVVYQILNWLSKNEDEFKNYFLNYDQIEEYNVIDFKQMLSNCLKNGASEVFTNEVSFTYTIPSDVVSKHSDDSIIGYEEIEYISIINDTRRDLVMRSNKEINLDEITNSVNEVKFNVVYDQEVVGVDMGELPVAA